MTAEPQGQRRVLYAVVCAAPPASEVHELVKLAQAAGWEVCVIATPEAMHWIDPPMLAELTGYDVRSEYRAAGEAKSLPEADAIAVAPATFNTVNKFRAGIADNMAVGVLCECLRAGVPIVLAPNVEAVLAERPAFPASLRELASWGVHVLEQAHSLAGSGWRPGRPSLRRSRGMSDSSLFWTEAAVPQHRPSLKAGP
jgi:phosphopantothenoylcysteine decarboxylase